MSKKVYVKETRNEANEFYHEGDWGVEVEDDFSKDNFTEIVPPSQCMKEVNPIPCDWVTDNWVVDTVAENHIEATETLNNTDIPLARVLEDLITALIDKGTITMADLPQVAQDKLSARETARNNL